MAEYGLKRSLSAGILRLRSPQKLITLLLLFILLTAASASASNAITGLDWASLWASLLCGLLVGWLLAIFRWKAWQSALLIVGLGLFYSMVFTGGLNGKITGVFEQFFRLLGEIILTLRIKGVDLLAFNNAVTGLFNSAGVVLGRVFTWLTDLIAGQENFDPVAAQIVWSFLIWLVAAWAGWMVEAAKNALAAVLPALLLCLGIFSYSRSGSSMIYLLLGLTLILIALVNYDHREQVWTETRVAYPRRKGREVGNASLVISIFLVVLAAIISSISIQRIEHLTEEIRGTSGGGESELAKSLGIKPAATPVPDVFSTTRNPGLPRELLIGSGPELSREQVMTVQVNDLPGLVQDGNLAALYWRSFTYDVYTGHGWGSSGTLQTQYQPDQLIQPDHLAGHLLVQEDVNRVPGTGDSIYADGEPVSVNVGSSAAWRSSNDLFGIQAPAYAYSIQSLVPVVNEYTLRQAGQVYPSWVTQRYLAVPAGVPARVKALAVQLTATEPTPYDRAHAIELYLRQTYPYTLDVPRPPANQDLVDYFLFDLRKGYCDYYASAMVVLAREAGIPARLAIGYASGTYNLNSRRFMVTQADAHSWVEVYFPGMGWVPFEPTAGLPAINRSAIPANQPPAQQPSVPVVKPNGNAGIKLGTYFAGLVLVTLTVFGLAWIIWDEIKLNRLAPRLAAREVLRRMKRYAAHIHLALEGGETPYEFSMMARERIGEITASDRLMRFGVNVSENIQLLIHDIVQLSYRPTAAGKTSSGKLIQQWKTLRWRLRLLWVLRIVGSVKNKLQSGIAIQPGEEHFQDN